MIGQKTMQWAEYAERIEKLPSIALRHICLDAQEAIDAMPDGINAGYYADEKHICVAELRKRALNKANRGKEYSDVLSRMYEILKEAGYNSFEMVDDLRDLVHDSQRPATEEAEAVDYKTKYDELIESILTWASTPQNHGGNPYGHSFMKDVPWQNRR